MQLVLIQYMLNEEDDFSNIKCIHTFMTILASPNLVEHGIQNFGGVLSGLQNLEFCFPYSCVGVEK